MVQPSQELQTPIGPVANLVSGSIEAGRGVFTVCRGIDDEPLRGQLRPIEISICDPCSANPKLAGSAGGYWFLMFIENVIAQVRDGLAQGDTVGRENTVDRTPHRSFGGSVHVPQLTRARKQLAGEVQGEGFAPAKDAQIAFSFPVVFKQHAPGGRRCLHQRDRELLKKALKLTAIPRLFRGGHDDLCAGCERNEVLEQGNVKGRRRYRQQNVRLAHAGRLAHGHQKVDQGTLSNHDAFWLSRGAGGVDHVGDLFGAQADIQIVRRCRGDGLSFAIEQKHPRGGCGQALLAG